MVNPNWGILQPVDVGAKIQEGYQQGRQMGAQNALSQYAANPDSPDAMNALARFAPQYAIQVRQQQAEKQAALQRQTAIGDALTGKAPASSLAYIDPTMFREMNKEQFAAAAKSLETVAEVALSADTPEEWDQIVDQLAAREPSFAEYRGRFGERLAIVAEARKTAEYLKQKAPRYQVIPEGGLLVNTRDPQALNQVANGAPQPAAPVTKVINGNTYYQVNGQWYDELPQGGSVGNGTGGF